MRKKAVAIGFLCLLIHSAQATEIKLNPCAQILASLTLADDDTQRVHVFLTAAQIEYVGSPKHLGSGLQNDVFEVDVPQYGGPVVVKLIGSLGYGFALSRNRTKDLTEKFSTIPLTQARLHQLFPEMVPKVHAIFTFNGETLGYVSERARGESVLDFLKRLPPEQREEAEKQIAAQVIEFNERLQEAGYRDLDYSSESRTYDPSNYFVVRLEDGSLVTTFIDLGMVVEKKN